MDPHQARIKARYRRQEQDSLRLRKGSRYLGLTLGAMALGVYAYSMYMIKQETILRDIDDEIEKIQGHKSHE